MSPSFAVAFMIAIAIFTTVQFILKAVKPAYQEPARRAAYAISIIVVIVLAAYWLLNTPAATSIS